MAFSAIKFTLEDMRKLLSLLDDKTFTSLLEQMLQFFRSTSATGIS